MYVELSLAVELIQYHTWNGQPSPFLARGQGARAVNFRDFLYVLDIWYFWLSEFSPSYKRQFAAKLLRKGYHTSNFESHLWVPVDICLTFYGLAFAGLCGVFLHRVAGHVFREVRPWNSRIQFDWIFLVVVRGLTKNVFVNFIFRPYQKY